MFELTNGRNRGQVDELESARADISSRLIRRPVAYSSCLLLLQNGVQISLRKTS